MYYVNPNIKNLYRTSYTESRKDFIRLDMNENPEGLPPEFFRDILNSMSPEYVAMYPETTQLEDKISSYLNFKPSNLCLTNGSDDAIRLLFQVFGEPGKNAVSVSPSFEMYSVYIKMFGMNHSPVVYDEHFNISLDDVLNSIDKNTGIIILLNPNSPIGNTWSETDIRLIIKKARENDAIVVIDEAYYYFSNITYLNLINEFENVMVFRTFSKMLSIAGCRLGYIISNREIISLFKKANSTYPVNSFAVKFAEIILDNPQIIDSLIVKEKEGREFVLNQLKKSGYNFHYNFGNYILIKPNNSPQEIFDKLKKNNMLIKTYNNPILADWIRITTASLKIMEQFWHLFTEAEK